MADISDPAVEAVAEAMRRELGLDDFEGDQLYEGTINYRELAAAAVAALELTEESAPSMPHWVRLASPYRQIVDTPQEPA